MKNLNLTFVAIIIALFALTSCEKESMQEMTAETATQTERNIPVEGINLVFDEVKTQASAAKFKQSAQGRNNGYKEIGCGFDYDGCTIGQGNSLDNRHYPSNVSSLADFDGEDEYFFFEVESTPNMTMTYDIALTGLSVDLDLFVFALSSDYRITETKAMSINSYNQNEKISLTGLAPGLYIVAVDAYQSGIAGHYNLTMDCSAVGTGQSVEIGLIETTLGDAFPMGNGEWTFIEKGSDIARVFQETGNDQNTISLENVRRNGGTTITTKVYMDLDNNTVAVETIYVESDGATAIGDGFGDITNVTYSN